MQTLVSILVSCFQPQTLTPALTAIVRVQVNVHSAWNGWEDLVLFTFPCFCDKIWLRDLFLVADMSCKAHVGAVVAGPSSSIPRI